ncbi:MAG: MarR family transcriptional regulator [Deltaproteobacteria bacterium]|nr:MarR family transcriptional regulator [Deltaproteobacteria bacterium]
MDNRKEGRGGYRSNLDINEKLMVAIVKASELFRKDSNAIFQKYGLTFSQYNVLWVLYNSPNGRNTMKTTSRIMIVSGANMTGLAKRLEKNGYIIRKNDHHDERVKFLKITPKGKQAINTIQAAKNENIARYLVSFSENEKKAMLNSLNRIFNKSPEVV